MRATMSAPMLGCSRSTTHSASSSGPGLESTAPATAIVPDVVQQAGQAQIALLAVRQPELAADELGELGDAALVLARHAFAHGGGASQRGCHARRLALLVGRGLATRVLNGRLRGPLGLGLGERDLRACAAAQSTVVPACARAPPAEIVTAARGRPSAAAPASASRRSRRRCGAAPRRRADRAPGRRRDHRRCARSCRRCARCARAGRRARAARRRRPRGRAAR